MRPSLSRSATSPESASAKKPANQVSVFSLPRAGGGDDGAPLSRQLGDEVATRARGVDHRERPRREPFEHGAQLGWVQVRAGEVEAHLAPARGAVADEHEQDAVIRARAPGDLVDRGPHGGQRRAVPDPRGRIVREPDQVLLADPEPLDGRVADRAGPLVEALLVGLLSGKPDHEQHVRLLRVGGGRQTPRAPREGRRQEGKPRAHTSPRLRRSTHSPPISPTIRKKSSGMSHRSRSSTMVTPEPVNWRSSGRLRTVAGA